MSYTIEIKEEISTHKCTNSEMIAELSGFIRNNATISNNTLFLTTENEFTIERLQSFFVPAYSPLSHGLTVWRLHFVLQ